MSLLSSSPITEGFATNPPVFMFKAGGSREAWSPFPEYGPITPVKLRFDQDSYCSSTICTGLDWVATIPGIERDGGVKEYKIRAADGDGSSLIMDASCPLQTDTMAVVLVEEKGGGVPGAVVESTFGPVTRVTASCVAECVMEFTLTCSPSETLRETTVRRDTSLQTGESRKGLLKWPGDPEEEERPHPIDIVNQFVIVSESGSSSGQSMWNAPSDGPLTLVSVGNDFGAAICTTALCFKSDLIYGVQGTEVGNVRTVDVSVTSLFSSSPGRTTVICPDFDQIAGIGVPTFNLGTLNNDASSGEGPVAFVDITCSGAPCSFTVQITCT